MMKRKTKFVQTNFGTEELGAKSVLMQEVVDKGHLGHTKPGTDGKSEKKDKAYASLVKGDKFLCDIVIGNNEVTLDGAGIDNFYFGVMNDIERRINNVTALMEKHSAGKEKDELHKERENLFKEKSEVENALAYSNVEKMNALVSLINTERSGYFKEQVAKIEGDKKIELEKIQRDPNQISIKEADLFSLVKKYDVLKDPAAFQEMVNNSTDPKIKADAKKFEQDIKDLGFAKFVKVDGVIDQNTIDAMTAIISKNLPAIKAYKEEIGVDLLRPSEGGAKPAIERDGK